MIFDGNGDKFYGRFFTYEHQISSLSDLDSHSNEGWYVVSGEVAAAMAEGVRRVTGSDYAVSTTGLAGPDGDERNPVGTVWVGLAGPGGTKTVRYNYRNDRKRNIERFAAAALDSLRQMIAMAMPQFINSVITIASVLVSMIILSIPLTALTLIMVAVTLAAAGPPMAGIGIQDA